LAIKSPPPLFAPKRGNFPPFSKERLGGILQSNVFIQMNFLVIIDGMKRHAEKKFICSPRESAAADATFVISLPPEENVGQKRRSEGLNMQIAAS
jgi:hypothetical protein